MIINYIKQWNLQPGYEEFKSIWKRNKFKYSFLITLLNSSSKGEEKNHQKLAENLNVIIDISNSLLEISKTLNVI